MVITVLFALSFIEVFSATSTLAYKGDNYWQPISMHVTFMLVGIAVAWIVHNMPMVWLKSLATVGYWTGVAFLVWAMVDGVSINGEARWVRLFGINIQSSEVARLGLVMMLAKILRECVLCTVKRKSAVRDPIGDATDDRTVICPILQIVLATIEAADDVCKIAVDVRYKKLRDDASAIQHRATNAALVQQRVFCDSAPIRKIAEQRFRNTHLTVPFTFIIT
jgi:hypothetical protein